MKTDMQQAAECAHDAKLALAKAIVELRPINIFTDYAKTYCDVTAVEAKAAEARAAIEAASRLLFQLEEMTITHPNYWPEA